jgi:hypothetical protein
VVDAVQTEPGLKLGAHDMVFKQVPIAAVHWLDGFGYEQKVNECIDK